MYCDCDRTSCLSTHSCTQKSPLQHVPFVALVFPYSSPTMHVSTWRGPVGASPVSPARLWAAGGGLSHVLCTPCGSCCAPPQGRADPEEAPSSASTMRLRWLTMPASFVSSSSIAASRLEGPGRFTPLGPSANPAGASKVRCSKATHSKPG